MFKRLGRFLCWLILGHVTKSCVKTPEIPKETLEDAATKHMSKLQLIMGGQISQTTELKSVGLDFNEQLKRQMDDEIYQAKQQAETEETMKQAKVPEPEPSDEEKSKLKIKELLDQHERNKSVFEFSKYNTYDKLSMLGYNMIRGVGPTYYDLCEKAFGHRPAEGPYCKGVELEFDKEGKGRLRGGGTEPFVTIKYFDYVVKQPDKITLKLDNEAKQFTSKKSVHREKCDYPLKLDFSPLKIMKYLV